MRYIVLYRPKISAMCVPAIQQSHRAMRYVAFDTITDAMDFANGIRRVCSYVKTVRDRTQSSDQDIQNVCDQLDRQHSPDQVREQVIAVLAGQV